MKKIKISSSESKLNSPSVSNKTLLVVANVLCLLIVYLIGAPGLRLVGTTFIGSEPLAIFENTENGSQDTFSPNTSVFGQARVVKIEKDRVTLRANGETFSIKISGFVSDETDTTSHPAELLASAAVAPVIDRNEYISDIGYTDSGSAMVVLSAQAIRQEINQLSEHFAASVPQPVIRDGRLVGINLSNVSQENFLKKVGLNSGDIVKSINGSSLTSPEQALELLNSSSWANVAIERNGQQVELSYVVE